MITRMAVQHRKLRGAEGGGGSWMIVLCMDVDTCTLPAYLSPGGLASNASAEHTLRHCELAPTATSSP